MSEEMHEWLSSKRPDVRARLREAMQQAIMEACRDPETDATLLYADEIIVAAQMVIAQFAAGSKATATPALRRDFCDTLAEELYDLLGAAREMAIAAGLTEAPRQ